MVKLLRMNIFNKKNLISIIVLLVFFNKMYSQKDLTFSGYLSVMPSATYDDVSKETNFDNLIHNRINLNYRINDHFHSSASFRNRIFYGETIRSMPTFKHIITNDAGWADLSFNWESRNNYVFNTNVDRLWLEYIKGKVQVKFGRQRVNWSKSMVWNPNDIFNSYSYLDFDYAERPGMDGVRFQYYTGVSSKIETVVKVDNENDITAAALYGTTVKGYDLQFLAGELEQEDWILGGGWSGDVFKAGFYGEVSYLMNMNDLDANFLVGSVGANYMFKNSLLLSGEYLYSGNLDSYSGGYNSLMYFQSSIKALSIDKHSYLLSIAWPVNPLLNISFAYMGFGFPAGKSFYIGPTFDYSVANNINISLVSQYFSLDNYGTSIATYLRVKWNF